MGIWKINSGLDQFVYVNFKAGSRPIVWRTKGTRTGLTPKGGLEGERHFGRSPGSRKKIEVWT